MDNVAAPKRRKGKPGESRSRPAQIAASAAKRSASSHASGGVLAERPVLSEVPDTQIVQFIIARGIE
jgi:hypothetical protein